MRPLRYRQVVRDLSLIIVAVDHDSSLTTQGDAGTIATVPTSDRKLVPGTGSKSFISIAASAPSL